MVDLPRSTVQHASASAITDRTSVLAGSRITARAFNPRRKLPSRYQSSACASTTYSGIIQVVELRLAAPFGFLKSLGGSVSVSFILAELQITRLWFPLVLLGQYYPYAPFSHTDGRLKKLDL